VMKPDEFADRFGLSAGDIQKLRGWLESQGLRVNDVARAGTGSRSAGRRADREGVAHRNFIATSPGGRCTWRTRGAVRPGGHWRGGGRFRGLNDFRPNHRRRCCHRARFFPLHEQRLPLPGAGRSATIYDLQPLYNAGITGAGQTIVVVGESAVLLNDITTFRGYFLLPVNNPKLMLFGPRPV